VTDSAALPSSSRFGSPAVRAAAALVAGLAVGMLAVRSGSGLLLSAATALEPIGTMWVNAIRMTVIPLVVSLLVATIVGAGSARSVGAMGGRAVAVFVALLSVIAVSVALVAPWLFSGLEIDAASAESLRAAAAATTTPAEIPGFTSWLVGLVPSNPIKAAADGAMLPLIVFTVAFALALTRTRVELRDGAAGFFQAIADAMLVLVRWILALAPIGVFALAVTLAVRIGAGIAGAVAYYLVVHSLLLVGATLSLYVVAVIVGGVRPGLFARAMLPAQVVAVSTRSSVAALPAMIQSAERTLRLPASVAGFALPFGVSVFRLSQSVSWVPYALFIASLYGMELGVAEIATLTAASVLFSFSVPGIPSGGLFVLAPFFMSIGLPVEGIGILIALDAIPDIFKTLLNVTGHMTATTVLSRWNSAAPVHTDTALPAADTAAAA
jgi:proton glutamate symport protein